MFATLICFRHLFDMYCVCAVLVEATDNYSKSLCSGKANEKQYHLGWKVDDLSHLNTNGRQMSVDILLYYLMYKTRSMISIKRTYHVS